jgi:hypothetical protein
MKIKSYKIVLIKILKIKFAIWFENNIFNGYKLKNTNSKLFIIRYKTILSERIYI